MVLNFITNHISLLISCLGEKNSGIFLSPERRQRLHSSSMLDDYIDLIIIEEGVTYQVVCDTGT